MITILMATYNGEKYLAEQIESILQQTYCGWKLIIQDDCSTDHTPDIAEAYQRQYPEKIKLIRRETPSGSAKNNFFSMLSLVEDDYVMFCDQDDVWLPDKIEKTLTAMKRMESQYGEDMPILLHTDLYVVDQDLKILSDSFFGFQNILPERTGLHQIIVQNVVTGCTVLLNKALLSYAGSVPQYALMHDWWLAVIAAAFGKIGFLKNATVYYRQHGENQVGAKNTNSLIYNISRFYEQLNGGDVLKMHYLQAREFLELFYDKLSDQQKDCLMKYSKLSEYRKLTRVFILIKYRFLKYGLLRKIGQLLFC